MTDYSNRIALWKNDKRKETTHPHLSGSGDINGQYWVSAWFSKDIAADDKLLLSAILNRYDSKAPFISISVKPKQQTPASSQQSLNDSDSEPPF